MRPLPARFVVLLVAPLLVLSACGGDDDSGDDGGSSSDTGGIEVTGDFGETPKVDIPDDYSVDSSKTEVVDEGNGDKLASGDDVLVQADLFNGTSGKEIANMFSGGIPPQSTTVGAQDTVLPGLNGQIEGQTLGSRVLISISPDDGFGAQGNPQLQIGPKDTMVALVDLKPIPEAPKATGTVDDVTVTGEPGAKPKVSFDKPFYVDKTESKVISPGDGAVVKENDKVKVDYVGVNGRTGKEFDSSFSASGSKPVEFTLSQGQLIPGFLKGLIGQKLGSRVAIAIPRDDGYGPSGNAQAGIEGTDTLVFVVDLVE